MEAALQAAHRELAAVTKQREQLARQLGGIASKIGAGVLPQPADLELPAGVPAQDAALEGKLSTFLSVTFE